MRIFAARVHPQARLDSDESDIREAVVPADEKNRMDTSHATIIDVIERLIQFWDKPVTKSPEIVKKGSCA